MSLGESNCQICHLPREAHRQANILHEYCPPGQQASLVTRSQQSPAAHEGITQGSNGTVPTVSGDAILRLALMRKGIIEVADLEQIENELRVTGVAFHDPGRVGHS